MGPGGREGDIITLLTLKGYSHGMVELESFSLTRFPLLTIFDASSEGGHSDRHGGRHEGRHRARAPDAIHL